MAMIGALAAALAHERSCLRAMTRKLHEHTRRKAQETTRKEETMPTLLEDLDRLMHDALRTQWLSVCEPAYLRIKAFIEANQPWLPPQQEGFGPWIEYRVGDPGPCVSDVVHVLTSAGRAERVFTTTPTRADKWYWDEAIVAYCVKLEPTNE